MVVEVPTIQGNRKEIVYIMGRDTLPSFIPSDYEIVRKRKGKTWRSYYNVSAAFDIETTTIPYNDTYYGFMYQWQFCLNSTVIFGRTWEEFVQFYNYLHKVLHLNEWLRLCVYVHNLPFEFQFFKDFLPITDMFSKDTRKPLYVVCNGIEFRCSYALSNMSLEKFCENSKLCYHYKLGGQYDYRKVRTPETQLTSVELAYCYNDVRGLCECIDTLLLEDTIATIPLTSTGYVRRDFRNAMKTKANRELFEKLALSPLQYTMCRRAFRGGDTHANRHKAGMIVEGVRSKDRISSYPACMMTDYFPMSPFILITPKTKEEIYQLIDTYCCLFDIKIFNLVCREDNPDPYIDIAHCFEYSNIVNDNGRVLCADYVKLTITELDFLCILQSYYEFDFSVENFHIAERGLLPVEYRSELLRKYENKTNLKGVAGKEYEYAKEKNKINGAFGMMVTRIDNKVINYDQVTMEWSKSDCDLEKALEDFYKSRNNFLAYQWGVWVTAHARYELRKTITAVGNDMVYCDTDSNKYVNDHEKDFEKLNKEILQLDNLSEVPAYADKDGERYYLGIWEDDGDYPRFKTLGAKKYCYDDMDGRFHITVSGMSKKLGALAVGHMENFDIGRRFMNVGRTVSYYNDCPIFTMEVDDCRFTTASNIGIVDTTYTMGITGEYYDLISYNLLKEIEKYS